jgi:GGDEF domain-containing protein
LIVVASEVIGMAAALSRPSTLTDAAVELAELVAISPAAAVLHYLDRLIAMADAEMYRSKKKGMNRVSVFDDP